MRYALGVAYSDYADSTLFDKTEEALLRQTANAGLAFTQPWGEVNLSLNGASYLHDLAKYNVGLSLYVDVRLLKGLSVNGNLDVSLVRDQLNLAKGTASDEDVLLRRRELATDWRYFFFFGVSYRFGSIFNNVVNPRFGGGSGRVIYF